MRKLVGALTLSLTRRPRPGRASRLGRQPGGGRLVDGQDRDHRRAGRRDHRVVHRRCHRDRDHGPPVQLERDHDLFAVRHLGGNVEPALQGASIVVYYGHGNGWPSPYTPFQEDTKDGLGLNTATQSDQRGPHVLRRELPREGCQARPERGRDPRPPVLLGRQLGGPEPGADAGRCRAAGRQHGRRLAPDRSPGGHLGALHGQRQRLL